MPDYALVSERESRDSNGIVVFSQRYESLTTPPPEPVGARNVQRTLEDGRYVLICDVGTDGTSYRITAGLSQEPIETHEMFQDIGITDEDWEKWSIWKKNPSDPSLNGWDPATSGAGGDAGLAQLVKYYSKGITSFFLPTVTVRQSVVETISPNLKNLGKIDDPPIEIERPAQANFLKWAAEGQNMTMDTGEPDAQKRWENNYEWRMSGPLGWDETIYAPSTE